MESSDQNNVKWHRWPDGRYAMVITYKGEVFQPMGAYATKQAALMAGEQRLRMFGDDFGSPFSAGSAVDKQKILQTIDGLVEVFWTPATGKARIMRYEGQPTDDYQLGTMIEAGPSWNSHYPSQRALFRDKAAAWQAVMNCTNNDVQRIDVYTVSEKQAAAERA